MASAVLSILSSIFLFGLSFGISLDQLVEQLFQNISFVNPVSAAVLGSRAVEFRPRAGASWNIQLISVPKPSQPDAGKYHIWDFDMFDAPKSTIQAFKENGHAVVCYFSAGSWENWRPDADEFPAAAKGKGLDGWPGERWLDTNNKQVRAIMKKRIQLAKSKGCDAVDADNMDGYGNPTGFSLTKDDAVSYVKFLSSTAHSLGLAYGLKNAGDIIPRVVDVCDFSVNEQCAEYNECRPYQAFIRQNKPVFHLEYTAKDPAPKDFVRKHCNAPGTNGFSTLIKHLSLNAWTTTCPA
jgi:hypothetical protein